MTSARGYAAHSAGAPLVPWDFERRDPQTRDVQIDIEYAGICHSDIHQVREEWGTAIFPMVPGHEIVGRVSALGSAVTEFAVGQRVGVGVYIDSCRVCANCTAGESHYCLEGMTGTYNGYERDGRSIAYGGYSTRIVTDAAYVVRVPEALDPAGAAPLMCAGITLYSPLRHWGAGPGMQVAVLGLGGLGHMGVKFARAMGAEVTVLSHSPGKRDDALRLGAHHFVSTADEGAVASMQNRFDLILNSVSANIDLNAYARTLRLNGTLVLLGLPGVPAPIEAGTLLNQRRRIAGSMIGSVAQLQEMLEFCAEHGIHSDVEVISADYINTAYERVIASDVKYRFVIDASTF